MPTASIKKARKKAHKALEQLFPRGERGVVAGMAKWDGWGRARERHVSKAELRRLAAVGDLGAVAHALES